MSDPNINHLCARIAIEECVRRGCRTIVVCPGSRSAPLAAAAAAWHGRAPAPGEPAVDVLVAHDERGAAFLALGAARVTGRAALVITTSGTAVANLLPAAVEASMDGIPMLLFAADRPPELHGCGANQSVPQAAMLAPVVRDAIDVMCPDEPRSTPLDALDAVAHAWMRAHGASGTPGPVHVNWRYREPLAPVAVPWSLAPPVAVRLAQWQESSSPWVPEAPEGSHEEAPGSVSREGPPSSGGAWQGEHGAQWQDASPAEVDALIARVRQSGRGVLVAGGARSPDDAHALARIARALGWPVIADITSGLRGASALPNVVHHADLALCSVIGPGSQAHGHIREALRPGMILRIGGRIASKRVQQWMDDAVSDGCMLAVAGDGIEPMDASRCASLLVRTSAQALADRLSARPAEPAAGACADAWWRADGAIAGVLSQGDACVRANGASRMARTATISEPEVARTALREAHRAGAIAMLSSSMPVRDAEMHADRTATPWCIANRGASGIDGIVATAAGACRASGRPVLLLIGDVAALHDLSSWALLRDLPAPMCVVVVNNDGGGIFRFLPIAEHSAIYSPWFDSPHGLTFEGAAAMFALDYVRLPDGGDLSGVVRSALGGGRAVQSAQVRHAARVVEVRASAARVVPDHREIQSACTAAVRDAIAVPSAQGSRG
jgi:2-succinyl-5-enolpyruvyl-6-hydroxy-3-cyclohexene-1-carboxylate synthase